MNTTPTTAMAEPANDSNESTNSSMGNSRNTKEYRLTEKISFGHGEGQGQRTEGFRQGFASKQRRHLRRAQ